MNIHIDFYLRSMITDLNDGIISDKDYSHLKSNFAVKGDFSENDLKIITNRFRYQSENKFYQQIQLYYEAYSDLVTKYPTIQKTNYQQRFNEISYQFIENKLNYDVNNINTRNGDEPDNIWFSIDFPACVFPQSPVFDPEGGGVSGPNYCDGWFGNNCQQDWSFRVATAQRQLIFDIIDLCSRSGDVTGPVIWTDWSALAGIPNNINGVGGYSLILSFLDTADKSCIAFNKEEVVRYYESICLPCIQEIADECCN